MILPKLFTAVGIKCVVLEIILHQENEIEIMKGDTEKI